MNDPRETRQQSLVVFLQVALVVTLVCSVAAVIVPGAAGRTIGTVTVGALIAVPLIRVVWLALRWTLKRDYRFAGVAFLLAGIIVAAELVGLF